MSPEKVVLELRECNFRIASLKRELEESDKRYKALLLQHNELLTSIEAATEIPFLCEYGE